MGPQDPGDYFDPTTFGASARIFADPAGARPVCAENQAENAMQPSTLAYFQCVASAQTADTHEIRLASEQRVAGIFDYVLGYFNYKVSNRSDITQETPVVNNLFGPPSIGLVNLTGIVTPSSQKEEAFFGNVTAHLGKFELSGGLRHITFHDRSSLLISGFDLAPFKDTYHTTIFNASAKYRFSDNLMVYATVGSSWRPGIHTVGDFNIAESDRERSFTNLGPEKSKSYELGFKSSFLDHRANLDVTYYHQDYDGYIYRGPQVYYVNTTFVQGQGPVQSVSTFNFVSSVPVKVDGVEVEASFRPTNRWSLAGNFSWANGRIKNGTIACNDLNQNGRPDVDPATPTIAQINASAGPGNNVAQCTLNGPATFAPKWNASLQAEYDFPVNNGMNAFARGLLTYYPSYKQDPYNTLDDVKSYAITNIYAGLRGKDDAWELALFAKNLFNVGRVLGEGGNGFGGGAGPLSTTVQTYTGAINPQSSYYFVLLNQERELGVNFRVAFGSR
jgi:iron complex outermembrane receptor protein